MKAKPKMIDWNFGSVRLYREDLEEILRTLAPLRPAIEDDDCKYENLDEVVTKRGRRPRSIQISTSDSYWGILNLCRFRIPRNYLHAPEVAEWLSVKRILQQKRRLIARLFRAAYSLLFLWTLSGLVAVSLLRSLQPRYAVWIPALWIVGFLIILGECTGAFNQVLLVSRDEGEANWEKWKERGIGGIVTLLVGLIILYIKWKMGW